VIEMLRITTLFLVLSASFSAFAVDDEKTKLARANDLASERLRLSSANLSMMKNQVEQQKLREELGSSSTDIIAISSNRLFVKKNNIVVSLKKGDKFKDSTIKEFGTGYVILANGTKHHAY